MKVWVVTEMDYDDFTLHGVFSTQAAAEDYAKGAATVEEIEVDEVDPGITAKQKFSARVFLLSGRIEDGYPYWGFYREDEVHGEVLTRFFNKGWPWVYPQDYADGFSTISYDHAVQTARDAIAKWMQENGLTEIPDIQKNPQVEQVKAVTKEIIGVQMMSTTHRPFDMDEATEKAIHGK